MSRSARQAKILDIINTFAVDTQEELVSRLRADGFVVTQATISRDIKELNLVKAQYDGDKYRYVAISSANGSVSDKWLNLFRDTVISINTAENLVVIKTLQGSAGVIANVVEQMRLAEVMATIAGTDALLVVTANVSNANIVKQRLSNIVG